MIDVAACESLVAWFRRVRSPYFFRQQRNPYRVWVAEVVLQQTRIQAALSPLQRFFAAFPDVSSLAQASEQDVLQAFCGLGYYSRARLLRKAAQILCSEHGGELPHDYRGLCNIPSIGPYTAAAIGSICFGLREPVLDGNVRRILARVEMWDAPLTSSAFTRQAYALLRPLFVAMALPPGEVNEALMELGQKLCVKTKPGCRQCPLCTWCQAYTQGRVDDYPPARNKVEKLSVVWHIYILEDAQGRILLQQWRDFYFLKGHTAFPSILEFTGSGQRLASWQSVVSPPDASELGQTESELGSLRHTITRHNILMRPYVGKAGAMPIDGALWLPPNHVAGVLVASALSKVWHQYNSQRTNHNSSASKAKRTAPPPRNNKM